MNNFFALILSLTLISCSGKDQNNDVASQQVVTQQKGYKKISNKSSIKSNDASIAPNEKDEIKKLQKQTPYEHSTITTQNIFIDLNLDGNKENFEVNFNDGTIKGNKNWEREIFLDKKSLIIQKQLEDNNPHDLINYKYYFNELNNSVILEKVEFKKETYVENYDICKLNYTYLPKDNIYFSQVDFFNLQFLYALVRDINLKEATEITTRTNQKYNCTSPLSTKELDFLIEKSVLDNNSVNSYNNLAYYLEQNKQYRESVFLLKNILGKYPIRVVAWINYGDSLWGMNNKIAAKEAYKKYISLMKSQNKDSSKIPKRVYDRIQ
ncbi:hypothetical protein NG800_002230 [Epilithonimonas ginsengisoli]|uniref:Tetratricopeptide repeat protein n=1 Tax=Epilithonimonas ginsengisoli TaxID=1245592 RepID=A0ABU4JDH6_9FLAO|nr:MULTISPECIES: hypothetical protein [Chryseobacterium group]MBV6878684.1 hypothetical protein [Epilithonimonas sp. FP105]MDW8547710.1 hypothetical protein [Epilithonimonas ginsengisoli]OAH75934.1 hypothetical protein AXA65_02325 [Chryseobacterium sp. FP211-J200]